jgi:hypothetical protein
VNGKGTIVALLMSVLGIHASGLYQPLVFENLACVKSGNTPELAKCEGERQVTVNEAFSSGHKHMVLDPTWIKKLISLDDPVATTGKYMDPSIWKPQCLLLIAANSAPRFPSEDGGCKSRLAFLTMPFKFVDEPKDDTERVGDSRVQLIFIPACVPEFLHWAPVLVQGMVRLKKGRNLLPRPSKIAVDTEAAFTDRATDPQDLALAFVDAHLELWDGASDVAGQVAIVSRFRTVYPGYNVRDAVNILCRVLMSQEGVAKFAARLHTGTKKMIAVYKMRDASGVLKTVTLKSAPVAGS